MPIVLDAKAFDDLLHAGARNHLLEITIDGDRKDTVLIRDVQRDPLTRRVISADLQRVSATEEITTALPLVTVGVPEGVRNGGGVMDFLSRTVEVKGPANAMPDALEADVSRLAVHGHLTAGDVNLPAKLSLAIDPHTILVSIEPSRVEQEAVADTEASAVPTVEESAVASDAPAENG